VAIAIVDGDEMGTRGVKDKEIFGSSLRRWTGSTGVAKLVA